MTGSKQNWRNQFTSVYHELLQCGKAVIASFFRNMLWVDPANWNITTEEEVASMNALASHFEVPLQRAGLDRHQLKKEWNGLKTAYQYYCKGQDAATFWSNSICHR